jgi:acyl carrier protein
MVDIQDTVFGLIAKEAKVDASTLTRETRFSDLNVDSLDVVEVIFQIEEKFDISIPYNANDTSADGISLNTLGEVVDLVDRLVSKANTQGVV